MKKEVRKKKGTERKVLKAIAFSEMFVMILASFAFAFIFSTGSVSAESTTITKANLPSNFNPDNIIKIWKVNSVTNSESYYYFQYNNLGPLNKVYFWDPSTKKVLSQSTYSAQELNNGLNGAQEVSFYNNALMTNTQIKAAVAVATAPATFNVGDTFVDYKGETFIRNSVNWARVDNPHETITDGQVTSSILNGDGDYTAILTAAPATPPAADNKATSQEDKKPIAQQKEPVTLTGAKLPTKTKSTISTRQEVTDQQKVVDDYTKTIVDNQKIITDGPADITAIGTLSAQIANTKDLVPEQVESIKGNIARIKTKYGIDPSVSNVDAIKQIDAKVNTATTAKTAAEKELVTATTKLSTLQKNLPKTAQSISELTGGAATSITDLKSLSPEKLKELGIYDGKIQQTKDGYEVIKGSQKYTFDEAGNVIGSPVDMGVGAPSEYSIFRLFKWTTSGWGHTVGNLVEGVVWAGAVIAAIKIFQEIGFIPEKYAKPLYQSIAGGIMAGKALYGILKTGTSNQWWKSTSFIAENAAASSFIVGAVVAYLIFSYTYKEEETKTQTLTFKCMSWQAPRGGEKCGECNKDPMRPCSEYRCKALGQSCELLNKGTGQEKCEWVNRNDAISPIIKPWNQVLTNGYVYASSASGMIIQRATENSRGNKCIDPYTPIEFGILTYNENNQGEPAQCKIEYTRTTSFSEMQYYFGDSNLYLINHSQKLSMPSISSLKTMGENETEGLEMEQTPGEYTFYVRCADANGNENEKEFAVRFCIDEGEDMTAPIIKGTSFGNQTTPVQFGQDNLSIEVYTNEPAQCKWEREDRDYEFMGNPMTCSNNVRDMNSELLYTCTTTLTSIEDRKNNDFFFRCMDLSVNENKMQEGYQFTVIGTQPLDIIAVSPNGTIAGSTSIVKTTLHVETANGYNNGESRCFYSPTGENSSYTEFFYNTSEFTNIHDQVLDLGPGTYHYYFRCIDLGGNSAENSTTFNLETDRGPPVIIRVYNGNNQLLIMTDEVSDCRYNTQSCSFNFNEGLPMSNANSTVHETEWKEQNYYIKCADIYNNQPYPTECSIVARPYSA